MLGYTENELFFLISVILFLVLNEKLSGANYSQMVLLKNISWMKLFCFSF
jgi:hypothetical protein